MSETRPVGNLEPTLEPVKRKAPNNVLGKDDFMSLMLTQIRHQDPLEPKDNTESIAQLAQFSSLEQMQNVATGVTNLLDAINAGNKAAALGMIGKFVEGFTLIEDENGSTRQENVTGKVRGVDFTTEEPTIVLQVGDRQLRLPQTQIMGVADNLPDGSGEESTEVSEEGIQETKES